MPALTEDDIMDRITQDGSSGYKAEKGRYHLYLSPGSQYSHRLVIGITLKGLDGVFSMDIVDYNLSFETGYRFSPEKEGCTADTINGKEFLKEIYLSSHPDYKGRFTAPVLFDKNTNRIVSNNSEDILKMMNSEFSEFCATPEQAGIDLYPEAKREEIDQVNSWTMPEIKDAVYVVEEQKTQEEYETTVERLFHYLDKVEEILSKKRFLAGPDITIADIMLFGTLVRFDTVYYSLYRCSKKPLVLYQNIWPYLRDIYQTGKVAETVNWKHIKLLFFRNEPVVPVGPELGFDEKPGRAEKFAS